ncbi:hypothetical protein V8687_10990 [Shewanella baltica]|uniref:hypothetical protein n=1 Tax=Shewanella baltica TaxID=62322 RepID=UPI0030D21255
MVKWTLLTALVLGINSFAVKAEIFKCTIDGVETYSQMPCADDAQVITVTPPDKISSDVGTANESKLIEQCIDVIKRSAEFKDPDSVKVEGHYYTWAEDDSGARRVMLLKVNAKNSYGGYIGGEYYSCFLNYNGTKLSNIQRYINKWEEINK